MGIKVPVIYLFLSWLALHIRYTVRLEGHFSLFSLLYDLQITEHDSYILYSYLQCNRQKKVALQYSSEPKTRPPLQRSHNYNTVDNMFYKIFFVL